MNNGKMEEIQLPDMQYYLDVESGVVAVADQQTGKFMLRLLILTLCIRLVIVVLRSIQK